MLSAIETDAVVLEVSHYSFNHKYSRLKIKSIVRGLFAFCVAFFLSLIEQLDFSREGIGASPPLDIFRHPPFFSIVL